MNLKLTYAVLVLPKTKKVYGQAPKDLLSPDLKWINSRFSEDRALTKPWKKFFLKPKTSAVRLSAFAVEKLLQVSANQKKNITGLISAAFPNDTVVPGDSAYLCDLYKLKCPHLNIESACSTGLMAIPAALGLGAVQKKSKIIVVLNNCFSKTVGSFNAPENSAFADAAVALLFENSDKGARITNFTATSATETRNFWKYDFDENLKKISFLKLKESDLAPEYFLKNFHHLCQQTFADSRTQASDYQHIFCHANTNLSHLATRSYFSHNIRAYNSFAITGNVGAVSPWPGLIYAQKKKYLKNGDRSLLYSLGYGGNSVMLALENFPILSEVYTLNE